jgi:hypothetical protein
VKGLSARSLMKEGVTSKGIIVQDNQILEDHMSQKDT